MADVKVISNSDNAVLLLDAARKMGERANVVRTTSQGYFLVPEEVAEKAGVDVFDDPKPEPVKPYSPAEAKVTEQDKSKTEQEPKTAPAKRTPRKRAAKKTTPSQEG